MATLAIVILLVFGVLGYSTNLFFRTIYLYEEWQDGNDIHWWWQAFLTFAVPATCVFGIAETMAVLGLFSNSSARFY
jgi:hypothetical protein